MRALDPPIALVEIARAVGAPLDGRRQHVAIRRLAPLDSAKDGDLGFLNDPRYLPKLDRTRAAAVILRAEHVARLPAGCSGLVVDDPYAAYAVVASLMDQRMRPDSDPPGVHPTAVVDPGAHLGAGVRIGPNAVVGAGSRLEDDVHVGPGCVIGGHCVVGARTRLVAGVTVYDGCTLGRDGLVHAGTVIGADGFGFARDGGGWRKIAQLGAVVIGDRVEIGANCAIDRGALDDTTIGDDCILDNLIQVAHNVRIGDGSALAGCVGVAGSAVIGRRCLIGGGAGILGHLELADEVVVSPMSLVTRSIRHAGFYSGSFPLMENAQWERAAATLRHLPDLRSRLRALEKMSRKET